MRIPNVTDRPNRLVFPCLHQHASLVVATLMLALAGCLPDRAHAQTRDTVSDFQVLTSSQFTGEVAVDGDNEVALIGLNGGTVTITTRQASGFWSTGVLLGGRTTNNFGIEIAFQNGYALVAEDQAARAVRTYRYEGGGQFTQLSSITRPAAATTSAFGYRMAISGDGKFAAIAAFDHDLAGVPGDDHGIVYIYERLINDAWIERGSIDAGSRAKSNGKFGLAVALSHNGARLVVGGGGNVHVFERQVDNTFAESQVLTGDGTDLFGWDTDISEDGNTILVGAPNALAGRGTLTMYQRQAGVWTIVNALAPFTEPNAGMGWTVAVSNGLATGGGLHVPGPSGPQTGYFVWARDQDQPGWSVTAQPQKSHRAPQGSRLEVSLDRGWMFVGMHNNNGDKRMVIYQIIEVQYPPLSLGTVYPASGRTAGGQTISIYGNGFRPNTTVTIGGVPTTHLQVSVTRIIAVTGPHAPGRVDIVVNTGAETMTKNGYDYVAPPASPTQDDDGDEIPTEWELRFGLDPWSPIDKEYDFDLDGDSNIEEFQNGTHPLGYYKRYLAEGARNAFFDTRLSLLVPDDLPANTVARYLMPGGTTVSHFQALAPRRRYTLDRNALADVGSTFSTLVESDRPFVLDRTMSWDLTGYGSHAEAGVSSPSTTWYLAEGSTSGDFALFYLLQNPNDTAASATVRFLRPFGLPPIERTYQLEPFSRTTIAVDDEHPDLASTDLSAVITATQPIIAERAMYRHGPGQVFAAGHESAGVTSASAKWFLAEGATGPFFDLFILIANPNPDDTEVRIDYLLENGSMQSATHVVPGNGRITVYVDDEQIPAGSGLHPLSNVTLSSTVTSLDGTPIIVERTMWWPGAQVTPNFWTETHNSPGSTATGTRWALAEGEVGGAQSAETYILIANTSVTAGSAKVTLYFEDGTTAEKTFALAAQSRLTVGTSTEFPTAVNKRFGAVIESLGNTPGQLVVERAMYTSPGGVTWAAGTNALATRF